MLLLILNSSFQNTYLPSQTEVDQCKIWTIKQINTAHHFIVEGISSFMASKLRLNTLLYSGQNWRSNAIKHQEKRWASLGGRHPEELTSHKDSCKQYNESNGIRPPQSLRRVRKTMKGMWEYLQREVYDFKFSITMASTRYFWMYKRCWSMFYMLRDKIAPSGGVWAKCNWDQRALDGKDQLA